VSETPFPSEFSEDDFDALDQWLQRRGKAIFDIVTLEGFLTPIVIGPNTLSPMLWLPRIWGGRTPKFRDVDELNQFTGLVMGFYNNLVAWFDEDPAGFEPTFYEHRVEGRTIMIVDEWCDGFIRGMRLDARAWKPLQRERPELLKPIQLFGTRGGWEELKRAGEAAMHAEWSVRIAPAVRGIHEYWLKSRLLEAATPGSSRLH